MEFFSVHNFSNYMDAHIAMGKLKDEGINCWLMDENTVTVFPIWTNAVGGIKLMVPNVEVVKAKAIIQKLEEERKKRYSCPQCGSHDVELVTTPRKASNWIAAIGTFLIGNYALAPDQVYHCFHCNAEFKEPVENDPDESSES